MSVGLKQVLLIESEFYTRVHLDDDLAAHGYQVTSVKQLRAALIKMKTQVFHMILISYEENVETPLRLLATLRHNFNQIPVVVMTKKPTETQLVQLMQFRPVSIIVKPYSLLDLVNRMETMLEQAEVKKSEG